jgi:hypothetical protein
MSFRSAQGAGSAGAGIVAIGDLRQRLPAGRLPPTQEHPARDAPAACRYAIQCRGCFHPAAIGGS